MLVGWSRRLNKMSHHEPLEMITHELYIYILNESMICTLTKWKKIGYDLQSLHAAKLEVIMVCV